MAANRAFEARILTTVVLVPGNADDGVQIAGAPETFVRSNIEKALYPGTSTLQGDKISLPYLACRP